MTKVTHLTLDERGELSRKRIHLREISGDADTPLETVGQDLRAARLRRGDDLATVARALKIRKDHLEALEEDRFEALPGRTYAVGFMRSYADYLGLDPMHYVERFKNEIAGRTEIQPTVGPPPDTEAPRLPQGWIVIGLFVLVLVAYVLYHLVKYADTSLHQPGTQESARAAAVAPTPAAPPRTAPAAPQPQLMANQSVLGNAPAGQPGANAPLPGTLPGVKPGTGLLTTPPPSASTEAASIPAGKVYGAQNDDARVVLRAHATTRILIQGSDGTVYLNRALQPGDSFDVPNKVGLTLSTPNGGAIAVELDGQMMGYAGQPSQMTEALSLDPQAIIDRYNRSNPG